MLESPKHRPESRASLHACSLSEGCLRTCIFSAFAGGAHAFGASISYSEGSSLILKSPCMSRT